MKIRLVLAIAAVAVFGLAATANAQDKALIAQGIVVYDAQKCGMCHSIAGMSGGKPSTKGPLDGVGSRLTAEEIRLWIVDPKTMTAKTKATRVPAMRAYPALPKLDLEALIAYVVSLKKK